MEIVAKTDTGKLRDNNEDAISYKLISPAKLFAMVADGMGGHRAGDVASQLTIKEIHIQLQKIEWHKDPLANLVDQMNQEILHQAQQHADQQGMGTTLVLCCIEEDSLWITHIGDSRCYQFADNSLKLLTKDHSLIMEMLDQGLIAAEDMQQSKRKNVLTRALGVHKQVEPTIIEIKLQSKGLLLLCSDGLTDMVADTKIKQCLATDSSLEDKAAYLIDAANAAGGKDNISVVLIKY